MQLRNILVLTAAFFVAAISPLAAQQASDSALAKPAISLPVSAVRHAPAPAFAGPRASAQFQRITPALAPSASSTRSSDVMDDSDQHVIVVSTLVLVLAVIIVVLLVAN